MVLCSLEFYLSFHLVIGFVEGFGTSLAADESRICRISIPDSGKANDF
jgi:hypothetical protein